MADELVGASLTRLLEITAYNLYMATLVGDPAPRVKTLHNRMNVPRPGDLVLEQSSIYDTRPEREGTRLGILRRRVREDVWTPAEWAEQGGEANEPIPTEQVWYIELADGREYRWINASFIAIPWDIDRYEHDAFVLPSAPPGPP